MQTPSNYPRENLATDRQMLKEVAVAQRQVLLCVLAQIGLVIVNMAGGAAKLAVVSIVVLVLALGLLVFQLISVSKLAKSLGQSPVLYVILMFVPCISLIALVMLSQKATTFLQQAGIKVGLLGADPNSI